MGAIKSFEDLKAYLTSGNGVTRKKMAVANAVDMHSLEAAMQAVKEGIVEAYLVGDGKIINETDSFHSGYKFFESFCSYHNLSKTLRSGRI